MRRARRVSRSRRRYCRPRQPVRDLYVNGADGETRTPTAFATAPSRQRVYQFHHVGSTAYRYFGTSPALPWPGAAGTPPPAGEVGAVGAEGTAGTSPALGACVSMMLRSTAGLTVRVLPR